MTELTIKGSIVEPIIIQQGSLTLTKAANFASGSVHTTTNAILEGNVLVTASWEESSPGSIRYPLPFTQHTNTDGLMDYKFTIEYSTSSGKTEINFAVYCEVAYAWYSQLKTFTINYQIWKLL